MKFSRRTYKNPGDFLADLSFIFKNRRQLRQMFRTESISPTFRERLMLAVTAVNSCRYCSYVHARQALKSGLPQDEIDRLLAGSIEGCPPEEAVAVLYAQHWAETGAHPDAEAVSRLQQEYGKEKAADIDLVLRMIGMANLSGNTWDKFLHFISFGHWGGG